jgi:hypothetical protein
VVKVSFPQTYSKVAATPLKRNYVGWFQTGTRESFTPLLMGAVPIHKLRPTLECNKSDRESILHSNLSLLQKMLIPAAKIITVRDQAVRNSQSQQYDTFAFHARTCTINAVKNFQPYYSHCWALLGHLVVWWCISSRRPTVGQHRSTTQVSCQHPPPLRLEPTTLGPTSAAAHLEHTMHISIAPALHINSKPTSSIFHFGFHRTTGTKSTPGEQNY